MDIPWSIFDAQGIVSLNSWSN